MIMTWHWHKRKK